MREPQISIIVPIYNADSILEKCIKSILNQSFHEWELILVDDGSTDKSFQICESVSRTDVRIHVVHKENGGVSSARNTGINCARAKYLTFIDCDDYVEKDYLLHLMEYSEIDYVVGGYYEENKPGEWIIHGNVINDFTIEEVLENPALLNYIPLGMVWGRRYRADILNQCQLRFETDIRRGEDVYFNSKYLSFSKTFKVLDCLDYRYCYNASSASKKFEPQLFEWSMKSVKKIGDLIGVDNEFFLKRVWQNAEYVINSYFSSAKGKGIFVQMKMIKEVYKVCNNKYVRKSLKYAPNDKVRIMMLLCIYPLAPYFSYLKRVILRK